MNTDFLTAHKILLKQQLKGQSIRYGRNIMAWKYDQTVSYRSVKDDQM